VTNQPHNQFPIEPNQTNNQNSPSPQNKTEIIGYKIYFEDGEDFMIQVFNDTSIGLRFIFKNEYMIQFQKL
jgi:hypothetical protein